MADRDTPTFKEIRELFREVGEKFKDTDAQIKENSKHIEDLKASVNKALQKSRWLEQQVGQSR